MALRGTFPRETIYHFRLFFATGIGPVTTVAAQGLNCRGHAAPEMAIASFRFGLGLSNSAPLRRGTPTKTDLYFLRNNDE